jgi:serine/threonine protein kinase
MNYRNDYDFFQNQTVTNVFTDLTNQKEVDENRGQIKRISLVETSLLDNRAAKKIKRSDQDKENESKWIHTSEKIMFSVPSLLTEALSSIPYLSMENKKVLYDFSIIIANEMKKITLDSNLHEKDIYYSKKTGFQLNEAGDNQNLKYDAGHSITFPWNFHIKYSSKLSQATFTMKDKNEILGTGTYKEIYLGHQLKVPLKFDEGGQLIKKSIKAIAKVIDPENFESELRGSIMDHTWIYNQFINQNLPGFIAKPPIVREYTKNGCIKIDLVQSCYAKDFSQIDEIFNFEKRLLILEELFVTIDSLSLLGITHRDITPENILLKMKSDDSHAYLNDFDLVSKKALGFSRNYVYWDLAGQIGLISHSSDLVSAMLTACSVLFEKFSCSDQNHDIFKSGAEEAFQSFISLQLRDQLEDVGIMPCASLNSQNMIGQLEKIYYEDVSLEDEDRKIIIQLLTEAKASFKILQVFGEIFKKEEVWRDLLLGSCIFHFANLSQEMTAYDYAILRKFEPNQLLKKFNIGIQIWMKERIVNILKDNLSTVLNAIGENDSEINQDTLAKINSYNNEGKLKDLMSAEQAQECFILDNQIQTLYELPNHPCPYEAHPKLFALLNSENPQEQKEGREIGYRFFGRALDVKNEILRIRKEYLEEVHSLSLILNFL